MERSRVGRIGIILQARMGSTRLPGKVVRLMAGRPMVAWCVERLRQVNLADELVVATSVRPEEKPLLEVLEYLSVPIYRGSENDVLDRYYQCAKHFEFQHVVRATGDNPLVDPVACDALIQMYLEGHLDYACAFPSFGSGFAIGAGSEIMSFEALEKSWRQGREPHHREHVNEYIQENPQEFKSGVLKNSRGDESELSLTVDTDSDFSAIERRILS